MRKNLGGATRFALAVVALAATTACAPEGMTGPNRQLAAGGLSLDVQPSTAFPEYGQVRVCNWEGPGTYTATATGGNLLASSFTLNTDGQCVLVWQATTSDDVQVTVTQTGTLNYQTGHIVKWTVDPSTLGNYVQTTYDGVNTLTVTLNPHSGHSLWFKNDLQGPPPPPPPTGGEGCTPGYWKQPQHFDSWAAPYTPSTLFSSVFADAFPGMNLVQVASLHGGGLNALGRHTVAALLSSASGGVEYDMSTSAVISAFNAAYASGDYETQKNIFAGYNEQGCPLD